MVTPNIIVTIWITLKYTKCSVSIFIYLISINLFRFIVASGIYVDINKQNSEQYKMISKYKKDDKYIYT